jgi:hypothetical protein
MAMKINAKVVGYGPDPGRTKALVNVMATKPPSKNKALLEQRTSRCSLQPTGPKH